MIDGMIYIMIVEQYTANSQSGLDTKNILNNSFYIIFIKNLFYTQIFNENLFDNTPPLK